LAEFRAASFSSLVDDANPSRGGGPYPNPERRPSMTPPDPFVDEPKWPAWKVTIGVIVFCTAFWAGIAYIFSRLFG
jgi:hypothetical protein